MRARCAIEAFMMIARACCGFSPSQSRIASLHSFWTKDFASVLPSFVFVCPSNCGSASFTEMIAIRPSRTSSPVSGSSFSLRILLSRAYRLMT